MLMLFPLLVPVPEVSCHLLLDLLLPLPDAGRRPLLLLPLLFILLVFTHVTVLNIYAQFVFYKYIIFPGVCTFRKTFCDDLEKRNKIRHQTGKFFFLIFSYLQISFVFPNIVNNAKKQLEKVYINSPSF